MFRILAIEPDPERARSFTRLVRDHVNADIVLVASTQAAIEAMSQRAPDLILTSALMTPLEDSLLTTYLKERDGARDLPVLTVPPLVDTDDPPQTPNRRLSPFRRRGAQPWPAYDPVALGARIEEALQESAARGPGRPGVSPVLTVSASSPSDAESIDAMLNEELLLDYCGFGVKRLRAHRWGRADLPWLSTVNLPWGLEVKLLNISSTGMLIESGDKFLPGSLTAFHLSGQDKNLVVAARIVRSQVAMVDSRGVRYRAAAVFDTDLDLLTQRPASLGRSVAAPKALTNLLVRVMDELEAGAYPASVRASFEQGLRRLVSARDIQIRDVPEVPSDGDESVCFLIPSNRLHPTVLQAIFEPNCGPQEDDIRILKAAATLAAFILQFEDVAPQDAISVILPAAAEAPSAS